MLQRPVAATIFLLPSVPSGKTGKVEAWYLSLQLEIGPLRVLLYGVVDKVRCRTAVGAQRTAVMRGKERDAFLRKKHSLYL